MKELRPCKQEIYENGDTVGVIGNKSAQWVEKFVRECRKQTGQQVDWHFVGGRAVIRALGDLESIRAYIRYFSSNYLVIVEENGDWQYK